MKKIGLMMAATMAATMMGAAAHAAPIYAGGPAQFEYYAYGSSYDGPTDFQTPGSFDFNPYFSVSASGDTLTYTYDSDVTWSSSGVSLDSDGLYVENGAVIYSPPNSPSIQSVTLDPSSQLGSSGFNASDITFNRQAVAVTWKGQTFVTGNTVVLDLNAVSAAPEPGVWALMLAGVAMIGLTLRQGRRQRGTAIA